MAKIFFQALGCRLNQAEAERMAQGFRMEGHEIVSASDTADYRVVNTCTVTAEAGRKSRRAARPSHDGQKVIVTGCHSQVAPGDFSGVDLLVRNEEKEKLVTLTRERFGMDGQALGMDFRRTGSVAVYPLALEHTRAFVKIQDGCNMRCAFCLTTAARGASRCRPADDIVEEIRGLEKSGCLEAVLTGVHAGSYAENLTDLGGLMDRILTETGIARLRLSSMEPWNFKPSWMELWDRHAGRLCRHLHMSLQSGSDSVLNRMRRGYTAEAFRGKINTIRAHQPEMAITTDLIAGFPGETSEEHAASLLFVKELELAGAHVFSYSQRPGTEAAEMPDQLPGMVRQERCRALREAVEEGQRAYAAGFIGRTLPVLWEQHGEGSLTGLTDNYLRVQAASPEARTNRLEEVRLTGVKGGLLEGEPVGVPTGSC